MSPTDEQIKKVLDLVYGRRAPIVQTTQSTERASELDWLLWFYQNADFGPAHGDVMKSYMKDFTLKTGKLLPKAYEPEVECTCSYEDSEEMTSHTQLCAVTIASANSLIGTP